jgi:Subtilase family
MKPDQGDQEKRKRVYFRPGEVLLLVEHNDPQVNPQVIADELRRIIISKNYPLVEAKIDSRRILTFAHGESASKLEPQRRPRRAAFSIVTLDVSGQVHNSQQLIELIEDLNTRFPSPDSPPDDSLLTLRVAAPNWLSVPTTSVPTGNNADGGGPGSRPAPYTGDVDDPPYNFYIPCLADRLAEDAAQEVDVAILDTAPSREELEWAYNYYTNQPLLSDVLSRLVVTYANGNGIDLPLPEELRVKDHDYRMADHGLFIAGIIENIAPSGHLHLIQVLNDFGVGTAESIAQGFTVLRRWRANRGRPLVVNCSLMLVEPMPGQDRPQDDEDRDHDLAHWPIFHDRLFVNQEVDEQTRRQMEADMREARQKLAMAIEWLCISVYDEGIVIVAAAGNDAVRGRAPDGGRRPEARFPAAFDSVVGVGALNRNVSQTDYSNRGDRPEIVGLATFGGKAQMVRIRPGKDVPYAVPNEAVLGVYIGKFPARAPGVTLPNENGWGWWAGTSFAAPVISGAVAALVARGNTPVDAVQIVRNATSGRTTDGEEIFFALQV